MTHPNVPRRLTRIARPREVSNAADKLSELLEEVKEAYPACYDLALSGRVYPETEPVTSGHGHSDPTGELASNAKNIEMRDDLRLIVRKLGEAIRAVGYASSLTAKLHRKADFRHHITKQALPKEDVISTEEHRKLKERRKKGA